MSCAGGPARRSRCRPTGRNAGGLAGRGLVAAPLPASYRCLVGSWARLARPASRVRRIVFVEQMGVPPEIDLDGTDDPGIHLVLMHGRRAIGTGRLIPRTARIGRVALLSEYRGRGLGAQIVIRLMREAVRLALPAVELNAQAYAVGFYRRLGFLPLGPLFDDAGIPHRRMRRALAWRCAAAAVLVRGRRFLLGRRAPDVIMGGRWDLFGGRMEAGESPEETLARELREELAVEAAVGPRLAVSLYDDPRDRTVFRCPVHLVTRWSGEISLNREHTACRWLTLASLGRLRLAHPAIPDLCAQARRLAAGQS